VDVHVLSSSAARLSVDGRAARRLRVRMSAATAVRIACGRQIDGQRRTEPSKERKRSALGARWTYTCWRVVLRGCRCRAARQACVHGEHGREAWRQLGCTQASCCGACIRPCENCLIHKACQRRRPHRRVIFARPITLLSFSLLTIIELPTSAQSIETKGPASGFRAPYGSTYGLMPPTGWIISCVACMDTRTKEENR
jgi:ferredoxin